MLTEGISLSSCAVLTLSSCHCGKRKSQEITKEIMRSYQETINVCYTFGVKFKSHIKILHYYVKV